MKTLKIILTICLFYQLSNAQGPSDFEDGTTQGWTSGSVQIASNITTGGPAGTDDNYLQLAPDGSGSGGKLVVFNNSQWTGNYTNNGIVKISFQVKNVSGSDNIDLRLSFKITSGSATDNDNWASSTNAIHISNIAGWQMISFPVDASNLTALGSTSVADILSNVGEIRIADATSAPSRQGDTSSDILGIDNIIATNIPVSIKDFKKDNDSPLTINLLRNYPNPFNPSTQIKITLAEYNPESSLDVYNMAGQKINTLFSGDLNKGLHTFEWDGKNSNGIDAATGVYIYHLKSGIINLSNKMILIR